MSLKAVEKVTEVERKNKERRAAAETEAKQMPSGMVLRSWNKCAQRRPPKERSFCGRRRSELHSGPRRSPLLRRRTATPCAGQQRAVCNLPPSLLSEG